MLADIHLWTDGSGTTEDQPGGWAYILQAFDPGTRELLKETEGSGRVHKYGTNNRMELTAVLKGLQALKYASMVTVHSDSEYVVKAFTEGWLKRWKARSWRKVKNDDLWRELDRENTRHFIEWTWVRGHNGNEWNERCDKLAGEQRRIALEEVNPPSLLTV